MGEKDQPMTDVPEPQSEKEPPADTARTIDTWTAEDHLLHGG